MTQNEQIRSGTNYIAIALAFFAGCLVNNYIKNSSQESHGSINPSNLEFKVKEKEATVDFNGTNYLITLGKNGRPRFQVYQHTSE